jgi:phosphatidate cytidylyltransferase
VRTRIISAAVGIPMVMLAVYLGVPAVGGITILAGLLGGYELALMAAPRIGHPNMFLVLMTLGMAVAGLLISLDHADWWLMLVVFIAGAGGAMAFEVVRVTRGRAGFISIPAAGAIGLFLAHGPILRSLDSSFNWILVAILVTYATDTAAYFVGANFGRRKIAPRISPNKTWEGTLGGIVAGIGATFALAEILDLPVTMASVGLIGIAASAASVLGDLAESGLKRISGVKDSGGIIPGHGGILDRIDSLAPNLVIVYWMAEWLTD